MPSFRFAKTIDVARGIKVFLALNAGITRDNLPDTESDLHRRTEAQNRQLEQIRQKLSEKDLQGALWEAGKSPGVWESAKAPEVRWWGRWLATKGLRWPDDYHPRLDPEQPLEDHIIKHLSAPPGSTVSILDVGAGPLTKLGKRWNGRTVQISAVDPLADEYSRLLSDADITPPIQTQPGEVERLTELFPKNYFDLANMQNALDHSHDPLLGIRQMLEVVKPGCYVVLLHAVNEGHNQNYVQLHQWNFRSDNGRFVIWNPHTEIFVDEALGDLAEVTVEELEGDEDERQAEILVTLRKIDKSP
jgi:SAM-dependent methyltransferase